MIMIILSTVLKNSHFVHMKLSLASMHMYDNLQSGEWMLGMPQAFIYK